MSTLRSLAPCTATTTTTTSNNDRQQASRGGQPGRRRPCRLPLTHDSSGLPFTAIKRPPASAVSTL